MKAFRKADLKGLYVLVSVSIFLSSCNSRIEKGGTEPLTDQEGFTTIERTMIKPKCVSCHLGTGAPMGVDLSSYAAIINTKSVVPFQPEQSKFFATIQAGTMPKGTSRLSDSDIQRVYNWIKKGALESPSVEPTPEPIPKPTLASIQKDFVDRKCVSCHQEATHNNRHVKLTNLTEVIEGTGPSGHVRKIIKPGCPKESFFHSIMREKKMPPAPAEKPTEEVLKIIAEWITNLKPGAICDDEPGGGEVDGPTD